MSGHAKASDPAPYAQANFKLKTRGCPQLDTEKLHRAVGLEVQVAGISEAALHLELSVACGPSTAELQVLDPVRGTRLRRQLPAVSVSDPAKERTIALAAVELIEALAWAQPETPPTPIPRNDRPKPVEHRSPAVNDPATRFWLLAELGVKWRVMPAPYLLTSANVGTSFSLTERWGLGFGGAFEWANIDRRSGSVGMRGLGGFVQGELYLVERQHWQLYTEGRVTPLYLRFTGKPRANDFSARETRGWAVDAGLGVGARFALEPLRFGVFARAGALLPQAEAGVEGEASVKTGGIWCGSGVLLGVGW
ncbi:MAG: hypothetical protein SFV15_21525 [Polyangiaceae bacterium]|nr:hypothetical protein [Polyangiaceae bacterium]